MTDTPIEVLNKYSKQIDELAENAEIEAELDAEKEIRSKNTKIVGISTIALSLMGVVYFLVQGGNDPQALDPAILEASKPVVEETAIPTEISGLTDPKKIAPVQEEPAPMKPEMKRSALKPPAKASSTAGKITKAVLTTTNKQAVIKKVKRVPNPVKKVAAVAPVPASKKKAEKSWSIQVGAFLIKDNANKFSQKLQKKGFKSELKSKITTVQQYVVLSGVFPSENLALERMKSLSEKGYTPNLKKLETGDFAVSLGQFHAKSSADKLKSDLDKKGFTASTPRMPVKQTAYTVQVNGYETVQKAKKDKIKLANLGFQNSFIH